METDCLLARLGVRLRITFMGRDPYFFHSLLSKLSLLFGFFSSSSKSNFILRFESWISTLIEIELFDIREIDGIRECDFSCRFNTENLPNL